MNLIEIKNDIFSVLLDPDQGTSISALFVNKDNNWLPIMPDSRRADIDLKYSSFLMIPYSNRIETGAFTFKDTDYQLANGQNHAIHGDVRFRPWQIDKRDENTLCCRIDSDDQDNVNWPWPFEASAEYRVIDTVFTSELTLRNRSDTEMPAGMGWHPYFSRWLTEESEPVHLCMKTEGVYPDANDNRIPSGPPEKLSIDQDFSQEKPIDPDVFVDGCFSGYDGSGYMLWPNSGIKITFDCSPECSHLVVYNPPKPYFAVEPVTNANNGVNLFANGDPSSGIAVLEPGESLSARFSMIVDYI